jgi:hypothetical protein
MGGSLFRGLDERYCLNTNSRANVAAKGAAIAAPAEEALEEKIWRSNMVRDLVSSLAGASVKVHGGSLSAQEFEVGQVAIAAGATECVV